MKGRHYLPAIFVSAFFPFNILGAVYYVDLNCTNPVAPYTSWATAATNIQDAVIIASSLDTVLVTNGIYHCAGISASGPNLIVITAPILLQSVNGPAVTVIKGYQVPGTTNGPSAIRCVYLRNGATLSGFTLTNGATPPGDYGGGVYCQPPNCLVTNCVIVGNAAPYGAGAFGGTLKNCIINGNTAVYTGGGAQQSILLDCVLSNNAASGLGSGGGAYNSTLIDCLLTGNRSGYRGGAAYGCNLVSCTIAGNTGQPTSIESCALTNCICYYNSPDNSSTGQGNNYFNNGCTIPLPSSGVNTITNPPAFADLAGGDFHLSPASPCINAGNNSYTTNSTDLDGNPRIVGGIVDIDA